MSDTDKIIAETKPEKLNDHNIIPEAQTVVEGILYDKRPAKRLDGSTVDGVYNVWITLDNPKQFNSYTTDMVKGAILAFRRASASVAARASVVSFVPVSVDRDKQGRVAAARANDSALSRKITRAVLVARSAHLVWLANFRRRRWISGRLVSGAAQLLHNVCYSSTATEPILVGTRLFNTTHVLAAEVQHLQ